MAADTEKWLCHELEKIGLDEEISRYIMSIEDITDQRNYITELIETDSKKNKFLQDWQAHYGKESNNPTFQVYQKQRFDVQQKSKEKNKSTPATPVNSALFNVNQKENCNTSVALQNGSLSSQIGSGSMEIGIGAKKKTKFVSLYSKEGQAKSVIHLPGRHICECQAAKHKLINNCIQCGRIVCEQEGAGPCVFCGSLVCTPEDQELIDKGSKKGEKLRQRLLKGGSQSTSKQNNTNDSLLDKNQKGFEQALQHRNKLLEYDKYSVRRTQVIDDECDYYNTDSNKWLNEEERNKLRNREEMLREARHGSKRDRKITLDFAGRKIIDAEDDAAQRMYDIHDSVIQEVHYGTAANGKKSKVEDFDSGVAIAPVFDDSAVQWGPTKTPFTRMSNTQSSQRIQDRELQEMSDHGLCLSMHQPWASLLVSGIKKDEGRTWYTAHRGRLWIASTTKAPTTDEIKEMESIYSHIYKGHSLRFPTSYPTASLLGCVNVEDCLSQEDYREQYPDGESNSPFVFICSNPQELLVKFPIKGKHKIYKLDQNVHQAAKKGLR
ncbi:activating signal cointegrator 1-like isoform X2 [Biomphalaria glabrata]|uniref:Activating signal cointegrator 1-like isoform X1 n=1 Tax=Biomphalaria glabrata TaxID=6526 RepID=A0A9W2Z3J7_BIOGL|nr:activating signal cointegrator 1-like isoform X1 [Biomphalaria glabrata]XP_055869644.1 activating signal cointegrator 1-like isoform X2 [Biomphalaria glabrata]